MRSLLIRPGRAARSLAPAFALAFLAGGCGGGGGADHEADSTTAELLAAPVSDGMSTPIAPGSSAPEGTRVEVASLGFNRGETDALVKVVELSDFGCGFCRKFHDETFPTIRKEFIETGMVEWKFVPYITGMFDNSLAATEAGECVMEQSPEAYERIAARMWAEQPTWKGSGEPAPILRGWVAELGVDMTAFDGCMIEDRRVERIASATTLARQIGVRGTPTFVVIGYPPLQGALPLEVFRNVLTAVHAEETRRVEESQRGN